MRLRQGRAWGRTSTATRASGLVVLHVFFTNTKPTSAGQQMLSVSASKLLKGEKSFKRLHRLICSVRISLLQLWV